MNYTVQKNSEALSYAEKELRFFLETYTTALFSPEAETAVELVLDPERKASLYRLTGDGKKLVIEGGSPSAVLCGVYEALGRGGVVFHADGHFLNGAFDFGAFLSAQADTVPLFRLRGIRQHINFTMDISSYHVEEAVEYIRNLARLRYNAITFHSYGGQWHPCDPEKDTSGHFFYGQRHDLPKNEPLLKSRIRNRKTYCIPEIEESFDDDAKRGALAEEWLRTVMRAAKEACMTVTLSLELPFSEAEKNIAMVRHVVELYPDIDTLELISGEDHADNPLGLTRDSAFDFLRDRLGLSETDCAPLRTFYDGTVFAEELPVQVVSAIQFLFHARQVLDARDSWLPEDRKTLSFRAGLYITHADSDRFLYPILKKAFPKEIGLSVLFAHGAEAVAATVESLHMTAEDRTRTLVYSWAEFDGNMFLLQQESRGIQRLVDLLKTKPEDGEPLGFCLNHWRTAENGIAIAYGAEAAVSGMPAEAFYRKAAGKLRIGDTDGAVALLKRMADLNLFCRDRLFNCGFCHLGCWCAPAGIGWVRGYRDEALEHAISEFTSVRESALQLLATAESKEGIAFCRLMENRSRASVLQLKAITAMRETMALEQEDRDGIVRAFAKADEFAQEYLNVYGELLPDRGAEGLLISYHETIPAYIRRKCEELCGVKVETEEAFDAPPPPAVV